MGLHILVCSNINLNLNNEKQGKVGLNLHITRNKEKWV
jgi:hypothetical protein